MPTATTSEWIVYCPAHRHYLIYAGVTGTTWTDDQEKASRYRKREAGEKAESATWPDHNPVRWAVAARE